jgi:hypothetical protein
MVVLRHVDWRRRRLKGLGERDVVGQPVDDRERSVYRGRRQWDGHHRFPQCRQWQHSLHERGLGWVRRG